MEYTDLLNIVTMESCMPIYYKVYMPDKACFSLHICAGPIYWSTMSVASIGVGDSIPVYCLHSLPASPSTSMPPSSTGAP